ncbi:hypothetical protein ACN47E_007497 [Coniothyrium glycines]
MVFLNPEINTRSAATTRSGFVLVSTYSWSCVTVGVILARYGQSLIVHKIEYGWDDGTVLAATVLYSGATVGWQYAVNGGLGKDPTILSEQDVTLWFKGAYVATILSMTAMTFAKLSSGLLIHRVAPQTRQAKNFLFGMIAIWGIFSFFAIAFSCGLPKWTAQSVQCHNGNIFVAVTTLNIVTDLVIAAWLFPTFWRLSFDKEKCLTAAMLFGARGIVPLVAAAQMWAVVKAGTSDNPSRDAVDLAVLTQSVTALSIIASSVPRIKRVLGAGGSGMIYPEIRETELSTSRRSYSQFRSRSAEPRLVPSGSTDFTVTISSTRSENKKKGPQNRQGIVSVGTQDDENTRTSSLFDRDDCGGVMMSREVRVSVSVEEKLDP